MTVGPEVLCLARPDPAAACRSVAANPTRPDHRSDLRPDAFPRAEVGSKDAFLMGRRAAIPPLAVVVSGSRGDQRGLHASSGPGRQGDV